MKSLLNYFFRAVLCQVPPLTRRRLSDKSHGRLSLGLCRDAPLVANGRSVMDKGSTDDKHIFIVGGLDPHHQGFACHVQALLFFLRKRGESFARLGTESRSKKGFAGIMPPLTRRGFTLVELMVVVGIIGILGAISVPAVDLFRQSATRSAARVEAQALMKAFRSCLATKEDISDCAKKDIGGMLKSLPDDPDDDTTSFKGVECLSIENNRIEIKSKKDEQKKQKRAGSRCHYNTSNNNTNTCFVSVKITGGYVAWHCVEYNSDDGTVKDTYDDKQGGVGKPILPCQNGKCQSPP